MRRAHLHRCQTCAASYECYGTLKQNYDGFPDVICSLFHEHDVCECDACLAKAVAAEQAHYDALERAQ